jgi:hypothetical protein
MNMTAPYGQTPAPGQPQYAQAPQYGAPQYGGPQGGGPLGKIRNPINVALLSIVTLGIYTLVYWFKTGNELKAHKNVGVGGAVYLILGLFVSFVPPFLLGNDVKTLRAGAGQEPKVSALTAFWLLIPLIGLFIYFPKVQGALNEYWASQGAVQA